jgi:hypothetical protein
MKRLKLSVVILMLPLMGCVAVPVTPQKPLMEKIATDKPFLPRMQDFLSGKLPEQTE